MTGLYHLMVYQTFQSCVSLSFLGSWGFFVGFVGFFFVCCFFYLFYFKGKTESQKSEVRLFSGSHAGIEDCKLSSNYSLMKVCSTSDFSCSSLNFILTSFYQNISPTKQLLNCQRKKCSQGTLKNQFHSHDYCVCSESPAPRGIPSFYCRERYICLC